MANYLITLFLLVLCLSAQAQKSTYDSIWPDNYKPESSRFYVHNEIEINASPAKVWEILIAAQKWSEWYIGASQVTYLNSS